MGVDVCSIYLLESDRTHLVLAATVGLRPESVGKVRMELHEGLAGLVAEQLRPVEVPNVKRHPRFKHFAEAGEDPYYAFLGVPLIDRELLQGVLIVQTIEERSFSDDEIASLLLAAGEISPIVAQVRERDQSIGPLQRRLWALARNMWWSWDASAMALFRDLDPARWEELGRNPVALLSEMPLDDLDERIGDLALAHRINHTFRRLQEYRERPATWGDTHVGVLQRQPVAYFSAEFGIHESLPIYSGGLGVLAGDHIKSASDLGVPLVGVGLFYGQGYFRQRLDASGWQQEEYAEVDIGKLPLEPALGADGEAIAPAIETRGGTLRARVWQAAIGRRTLLLLDSDVEDNTPQDRALTARLYGGDARVRIRQELLLGIGGLKALQALGIEPGVFHLNEGHSAFAVLEAIRRSMEREGVDFETAARQVARRTVFTTHTPVPAGHDRFPPGPGGRAPGTASRRAWHLPRATHEPRAREFGRCGRGVLHDRAGTARVPARERGVFTARRRDAAHVGRVVERPPG